MSSTTTRLKYRPDIDGLRAIAVLSVIGFHAFPNHLKGGFIGVDVFFVISGYLISRIILEGLDSGTFSFFNFYSRRIRRIFPSLIVVLSISYIVGWFTLLADEYKQLGIHILSGAGFFSNLLLWKESGYFDSSAETKPLLHLWSLGVEEQFYVAYPLLLWILWRIRCNLFFAMLVIGSASFLNNIKLAETDQAAAFFSPQTRFWELMCGGCVAYISLYSLRFFNKLKKGWLFDAYFQEDRVKRGRGFSNVISIIGITVLAYGLFTIGGQFNFPGIWALVPVLSAIFIILAGPHAWINKNILSNRIVVFLGLISFPLYLWHWIFLSYARIFESAIPNKEVSIVAIIISIVLACLTYFLIEKPFRYGEKNKLKVNFLVIAMIAIGIIGFTTYKLDGIPLRPTIRPYELLKLQFLFSQNMGRPSEAKIMLLGDSHAAHLIPGLKKYFDGDVADYTESGCIPFYDVDRYDSRFIQGACAKSMNLALDYFVSNQRMTGIILSSMGSAYLSGEAFNNTGTERVRGDGVKLINHLEITNRWDVYALGMRHTLSRLTGAKKKILFVIDVPELGFDPQTCFDLHPVVLTSRKRSPCAVLRKTYESRNQQYKTLIYSVLKDFPAVRIYDPTDSICDKEFCWAIKNGMPLYRDMDHLSNEGSYMVIEKMSPYISFLF